MGGIGDAVLAVAEDVGILKGPTIRRRTVNGVDVAVGVPMGMGSFVLAGVGVCVGALVGVLVGIFVDVSTSVTMLVAICVDGV